MMKKPLFLLPIFIILTSCVSYDNYYKLDPQYLERRQLETRRFETDDEDAMLVASAQVLQDLGFTIEESETKLGLITASKMRDAKSFGGVASAILVSAILGGPAIYDVDQKIYITLVSTKSRASKGFNVRVEFMRIVKNSQNQARFEIIKEPEIYQNFFDKLSHSLFLTANNL